MENNPNRQWREIEQKNYEQHDRELARRLTRAAWEKHGVGNPDNIKPKSKSSMFMPEKIKKRGLEQIQEKSEAESVSEQEQELIGSMRKLIWRNLLGTGRQLKELDRQETENELLLEMVKEEDRDRVSSRTDVTDTIRNELDEIRDQREKLAEESPESFTFVRGLELREHVRQVKNGEMVITPYVKEHLAKVERNISEGRPTFLHGHLGSGKTELAINAAKNAAINRAAREEADKDIKKYMEANPDSTGDKNLAMLGRLYTEYQTRFKEASRSTDRFSPLIISGSKDLTSQDLFVDKTLKLTKFNGKSLLEHKDDLDAEIAKWEKEHPEEAKDPVKRAEEANKILELFKLKNQAFGTEVETVKQAIYRGVEEGRPVIIDEVNAIPAAILISLNDILQRRPGDSCYIPGVGAKTIQPGFALIMTGNLSTGSINYGGTEDLNPAFLSRLDVIEHDYLPMSDVDRNHNEQINPEGNELFHVAVSYLADKKGNLTLPEMEKSLGKLFSFCQLAHETQLVFEGKWRESISTKSGDQFDPNLEKSVLSIRNMLNVLKEWDKGSEKDLDTALWDGFISGITDSDDQNFILAMARQHGFFSERDGWKVQIRERGAPLMSLEDLHPDEFDYQRASLETLSVRKTVELLYGPGPEREIYPEDIDIDEIEDLTNDETSIEDLETFEEKLSELNKTIQALSVLGEQCGCNIDNTNEGSNG